MSPLPTSDFLIGAEMNFRELIRVLALGFAQDLPYVGGLIRAYATALEEERGRQERQREKQEFLDEIGVRIEQALGRQTREEVEIVLEQVADEGRRALTSTSIQVQAEAVHRLETAKRVFQRRFLYLAADNYASAALTAEIAGQHGFLWRSYHADRPNHQSIPRVEQIESGDLIVLAYRDNGHFFILSPLIVMDQTAGNQTINDNLYSCSNTHTPTGRRRNNPHSHAPFVLADPVLEAILPQENYPPDPVFHRQCGLNVRALLSDVTEAGTGHILQGRFVSPKPRLTIWPHDHPEVPGQVTDWIAGL
jgi:hypothetical protein